MMFYFCSFIFKFDNDFEIEKNMNKQLRYLTVNYRQKLYQV